MTPEVPDSISPVTTSAISFTGLANRFTKPPGKLYLLYGDPLVFRLSLALASQALASDMSIAVVDGCNRFDAHSIARFARQRSIDPDVLLNRIFVSRGFTCYQMEAAITSRLFPMLECIDSRVALIFGLLDTFYDEQAPLRETTHMLDRIIAALRSMKSRGISILLACKHWNVIPKERNNLFTTLKTNVDSVYRLEPDEQSKPQLFLESAVAARKSISAIGLLKYGFEKMNSPRSLPKGSLPRSGHFVAGPL